jgi:hypothetical protein
MEAGVVVKVIGLADLLGRQNLQGREMILQMDRPQHSLHHPDHRCRFSLARGGHSSLHELAVELGFLRDQLLSERDRLELHDTS